MFERFWASSFVFYLYDFDFTTLFLMLGEWVGFIIVAYQLVKRTPLWLQFPVLIIGCGFWVFAYEFVCFLYCIKFGYMKGWPQ